MNTDKMNVNELEQVNGGNFIKEKIQEVKDLIDVTPKPVIAHTK